LEFVTTIHQEVTDFKSILYLGSELHTNSNFGSELKLIQISWWKL